MIDRNIEQHRQQPLHLNNLNAPLPSSDSDIQTEFTNAISDAFGEQSEILQIYINNHKHIFQSVPIVQNTSSFAQQQYKDIKLIFNLPLPPVLSPSDESLKTIILEYFAQIVERMRCQCKVALQIGGILEVRGEDNSLVHHRYFDARDNFNLLTTQSDLQTPYLFQSKIFAVEEMSSLLDNVSLANCVSRPDTKSSIVVLSNIHFTVFETGAILLHNYKVGDSTIVSTFPAEVDEFICRKPCIYTPPFSQDKDCIWQCLHQTLKDYSSALEIEQKFKTFLQQLNLSESDKKDLLYGGLRLFKCIVPSKQTSSSSSSRIPDISAAALLEECFGIHLYIYTLSEEDIVHVRQDISNGVRRARIPIVGLPLFISSKTTAEGPQLNLLLQWNSEGDGHCYLIRDTKTFFKQYRCPHCTALFTRRDVYQRHHQSRSCLSPFTYPGGTFQRAKSIWEQCTDLDIDYAGILGTQTPHFNHCLTFDIETGVYASNAKNSNKQNVIGEHRLVSIAYKSNIPNMEETRFHSIWDDDMNVN